MSGLNKGSLNGNLASSKFCQGSCRVDDLIGIEFIFLERPFTFADTVCVRTAKQ